MGYFFNFLWLSEESWTVTIISIQLPPVLQLRSQKIWPKVNPDKNNLKNEFSMGQPDVIRWRPERTDVT